MTGFIPGCCSRVSTAGDKRGEMNGLEEADAVEKGKKGKQNGVGSSLFSELIDDRDDDFSKMCREGSGGSASDL